MRQNYAIKVKATIEGIVFLRANNVREAKERTKENLKEDLMGISLSTKDIKIVKIQGEHDV